MKVLVTGGSGYVGSRFIKKFSANYTFQLFSLQSSPLESLDFTGVDVILHCAALVHQKTQYTQVEYDEINAQYPFRLARSAKENGVKHFIFMSTIAVYQESTLINEFSPCVPSTPYGKSKLKAEQLLKTLSDEHFIVSILRSPMVYGPNAPGNIASLSKLIRTVPILPFDGINNKRTFIGIDNLIALIHTLLEKRLEGIFLASDDTSLSTTQLIRLITKALNKKVYLFRFPFLETILKNLKPTLYSKLYGSLVINGTNTRRQLQFYNPYTPQEGITRMFHKEVSCY